ncbi:Subtilisin-like protease SBT5.1, partial [Mucuna pruriens]
MGAADSTKASLGYDHAYVLNSVLTRNEKALVRNYKHGFSGFAARLSKEETNSIGQKPGVVSVLRDLILNLHKTRSWDFLKDQIPVKIHHPILLPRQTSSLHCHLRRRYMGPASIPMERQLHEILRLQFV